MTVCVNGKWLAQAPSGTQRYATEVMRIASAMPAAVQICLILPRDAAEPRWASSFSIVRSSFRGVLFEQVALPWLTRGKHLYSLCGPAPLLKRDQTVVLHDAAAFRFPSSFRLAFVLWHRLMYAVLSRTAKRVLTVSSFSRAELASVLRLAPDRFELAPCASDHIEPQPVNGASEPLPFARGSYALIVGNLAPHKNVNVAVAALADAGVRVAVVGGAQHVFRGVQLADRDNVRLLGRIDDEQLQRLYAGAAVLVAPSRYEGFCIPIIEAGKLGCPTVFATGSAMTEVAGEGGLAFAPGDLGQCVEMVNRLMSDPPLRERFGAQARTNADRFSWARTAQTIFAPQAGEVTDPVTPVRVLHVTETFAGGIRASIIGYADGVSDQGVESYLLAQDRGSGLFEELDGTSPFVATRMVPHGLLNLWRAIGSSVKEFRPDVVHLNSSLAGGVGRLRFGLKGKPALVYTPNGFSFEMRTISPLKRWAYWAAEFVLARRTAAFVCVSPHEAKLARELRSRAEVVEMLNTFAPAATPPPPTVSAVPVVDAASPALRIVTVGRVAPQKDPELFAEIITALRMGGPVETTWVGDGPQPLRAPLETADVAITGWRPATEVAAALQGYDVYLHSASWEGAVPITAYEAMDAGLPVVIRRHPAYDSLLPIDWQFDDVAEAVRMVRVLAQEPARSRRVDEQFKLMAELRRSGPDAVLAAAYRRRLRRAWPGLGGDRNSFVLDTPSAPGGGTDVEDARWVHRSSLS